MARADIGKGVRHAFGKGGVPYIFYFYFSSHQWP
jgi:hypothetical protein